LNCFVERSLLQTLTMLHRDNFADSRSNYRQLSSPVPLTTATHSMSHVSRSYHHHHHHQCQTSSNHEHSTQPST